MKQPTKKIFVFVTAIIINIASYAQQQGFHLAINYNLATPVSTGFRDYINKTSFNGFQASLLYSINNNFRVGVQGSWNDFYQKYARQVYKNDDGSDISAVLSNTLQQVPVVVKGEYSFGKSGWLQPYIGLGAGINVISFQQYVGEFSSHQTYSNAAFTGDAGLLIPFSRTSEYGARLSTSYNMLPFNKQGIKNLNTWNIQGGIVIPLR
jgi:opacity protein-like surface antigen